MKLSVCIIYNKGKNCFRFTHTHKCMHTCVRELGYDVKMSFLLWSQSKVFKSLCSIESFSCRQVGMGHPNALSSTLQHLSALEPSPIIKDVQTSFKGSPANWFSL